MGKRFKLDSEEIHRLRKEVEKYLDSSMSIPDDFAKASECIRIATGEYLSSTTLMRIWGYVRDTGANYSPSVFSLRVLCNLIGFRNMEEYLTSSALIQSKEYYGRYIESNTLPEGTDLEVSWSPNRRIRLRHLGSTLFEVLESENSRLKNGDKVECGCFTSKAPAYFNRVFRAGVMPFTYVAGSAYGITYKVVPKISDSYDNDR